MPGSAFSLATMGTSWSREAAALLACDAEEPREPSSKDINYEKFFKDLDELREVRKLYDAVEDAACPKKAAPRVQVVAPGRTRSV